MCTKISGLPRLCLVLIILFGSLTEAAIAGDVSSGRAKAQVLCSNCHGEDGVAVLPGAANLSGQQKEYLRDQLRAYRSGSRRGQQMSIIAKSLSDADIENLATWYASIKISVELPQ